MTCFSLVVSATALISSTLVLATPVAAQISGRRIAIIDDYANHGSYSFYGDTHQPTAWLATGSFSYNGVTTPGAVISTVNDGGRNTLADSPRFEGKSFLTRNLQSDYANNSGMFVKRIMLLSAA